MTLVEFNRSRFSHEPLTVFEKPYSKVVIDAKDHSQIYYSNPVTWDQSTPMFIWNYPSGGTQWIGLNGTLSTSSAYLTKNIEIAETGLYQIKVKVLANNWQNSQPRLMALKIDGVQKGESQDIFSYWISERYIDFGVWRIQSGTRTFRLDFINKDTWAAEVLIYKINRFTTDSKHSDSRIDVNSTQFTQNTINELNSAGLTLPMRDDYFVPEKNAESLLCFDLTDSITIFVGGNRKQAKAMFGGYLIGHDLSDDNQQLTLQAVDTMLDLYREPVYANFYIGVAPSEGQTNPALQFNNIYDAIHYLCKTQAYWINPSFYGQHGFTKNFGSYQDFDSVGVVNFLKTWDKRNGYPAPGMRLNYDALAFRCATQTIEGYASLYNSDESLQLGPYNAKEFNLLGFHYFASTVSSDPTKNFQCNVRVNMHKAGESPEDAKNYIIYFSGKGWQPNAIGSVYPNFCGSWQTFKFDLGAAFDKYANSSAYYINQIDLVDQIQQDQVTNRSWSSLWIDNPGAWGNVANAKFSSEQEAVYPFEVIKAMCEKGGFAAWMDYGRERRFDTLRVAPLQNDDAPEQVTESLNVLNIYNKSYNPRETLANKVVRYWNNNATDPPQTGKVWAVDQSSLRRYGPFQNFENLSDVSNPVDATTDATNYLEMNSTGQVTFSMDIKGNTTFNPSNYVVADIPGEYLSGNHAIKAIIHDLAPQNDYFKTQIDVGVPSRRFRFIMSNMKKQLNSLLAYDGRTQYNQKAMRNLGFTSPGGFIKTG